MYSHHAIITMEGEKMFLQRGSTNSKITVNGKPVESDEKIEVHHHYRVLFGSTHLYCLSIPTEREAAIQKGIKWKHPKYADAQV